MSDFGKRLGLMAEMRKAHLVQLRANCALLEKDVTGSASKSLAGTLRFLGVADYVLNKDVAAFKDRFTESVQLSKELFDRFDAGRPIDPSYVSMMSYKELFDALASGDADLSKELARRIGGRNAVEVEYDRPFDVALGYSLKNVLLGSMDEALRHLDLLDSACLDPDTKDFKGYAIVLRAILNGDVVLAQSGFNEVIVGHKHQCKRGGLFKDMEDELLSVWGIGLANLARICGVMVELDDSLIPADLLAP